MSRRKPSAAQVSLLDYRPPAPAAEPRPIVQPRRERVEVTGYRRRLPGAGYGAPRTVHVGGYWRRFPGTG